MIQMFDGKLTVDITNKSDNFKRYLIEFKEEYDKELNKRMEAEKRKAKQVSMSMNSQRHAEILKQNGGQ